FSDEVAKSMLSTKANRDSAAASLAAVVAKYGFDGVMFDLEELKSDDADGLIGAGGAGMRTARPLRLLVVGDSTAMGTGVQRLEDGVPGQLGRLLVAEVATIGGVAWRAVGRNGATAAEVLAEFAPAAIAAHFDLAVVMVGWNDVLRLRSGGEFSRALGALLDRLHGASPDARLVVVAPPDFGRFSVLPNPLRWALGRHARALTSRAERVAHSHSTVLAPGFDGRSVASDRFHPDADGYRALAEGIVGVLA
ncbi:MAG: SGNH/GDSL hydrolase family protein, partial [Leifsonia sp.]